MALLKPATPFYTRLAMVLVSLLALFYIAIQGKSILAPLVFALLFAVLLLPMAGFMERRLRFPRSLAALLSVLLLVLSIVAVFYLVGSQLSSLADDWPQFKQQVLTSLGDLQHWISTKFHVRLKQQQTYIDNAATHILSTGSSMIGDTLLSLSSLVLFMV